MSSITSEGEKERTMYQISNKAEGKVNRGCIEMFSTVRYPRRIKVVSKSTKRKKKSRK